MSVVKSRQVETAQARGVGENVDFDDLEGLPLSALRH